MSDSSCELPDWVKSFASPNAKASAGSKPAIDLADSDSEDALDQLAAAAAAPSGTATAAAAAAAVKQERLPAAPAVKARAGKQKAPASEQAATGAVPGPSQQLESDVGTQTHAPPSQVAEAHEAPFEPQAAETGAEAAAAGAAAVKGEVVVMLPDKMPATKMLMELRPTGHSETAELAGDAGAVGRMVVNKGKDGTSGTFQVDLKGVLYDASILPMVGTAMVLNIGQCSAKVEAVMHDFVRLQEDVTMGVETVEGSLGNLLGDDDEVYHLEEDGGGGGGDAGTAGEPAGKKKKSASAADKKSGGKRKSGAAEKGMSGLSKLDESGGVKKVRKVGTTKKASTGAKGKAGKAVASGSAKAMKLPKGKGSAGAATKGSKGKGGAAVVTKGKSPARKRAKKASSNEEDTAEESDDSDAGSDDGDDSDYE